MLNPSELYRFETDTDPQELRASVMVVSLGGFMDAGHTQRLLTEHLLATSESSVVACFDVDQLMDYRGRRPGMVFDTNRWLSYEDPCLALHRLSDRDGTPYFLLAGPEPDYQWERVSEAIRQLVVSLGVTLVVSAHGIPMAVPHTRPIGMTAHATDPRLIPEQLNPFGRVEVPGSLAALLELRLGEDVVDVLDADREAHQAGGDTGSETVLVGALRVRRRGGVDGQRADIPDVGHVAVQGQRLHEALAGLDATRDLEGEHRPGALRGVLAGLLVGLVLGQRRPDHALDLVLALEVLGDPVGVLEVAVKTQAERLDALRDQERVERRDGRAEVAQQLHARLEDEGQVRAERRADAEVPGEHQPVVALLGRVVVRELLRVLTVVERATVDDDPRDRGPVSPKVFRRGVHDHVGAPLQGPDEVGRGDRVVDDERHTVVMRDPGNPLDVEHLRLGVGDRLREEQLGVGPHCRLPGLEVVGVLDEADLEAELRQRVLEQVEGAAIQRGAGDHVVAGLGDVEDREGLGGLAGGDQERADAALEGGDALLDRVLRGVHDPRVDVAELFEGKEIRGVVGVLEDVGRGLVDREGPSAGGGVRLLADVDLAGLEGPVGGVAHDDDFLTRMPCAQWSGMSPTVVMSTVDDGAGHVMGSPALALG